MTIGSDKYVQQQVDAWLRESIRFYYGDLVDNEQYFSDIKETFSSNGFFVLHEGYKYILEYNGEVISTFSPRLYF